MCHLKPKNKSSSGDKGEKHKNHDKWRYKQKKIDAIQTEKSDPNGFQATIMVDQLYFDTLSINQVSKSNTQAVVEVQVSSLQGVTPLWCKVDTGAEGNVIPVETYKKLYPKLSHNAKSIPLNLTPSNTVITAYGGTSVSHFGTCPMGNSLNPVSFMWLIPLDLQFSGCLHVLI